jgi:hypothetical protein
LSAKFAIPRAQYWWEGECEGGAETNFSNSQSFKDFRRQSSFPVDNGSGKRIDLAIHLRFAVFQPALGPNAFHFFSPAFHFFPQGGQAQWKEPIGRSFPCEIAQPIEAQVPLEMARQNGVGNDSWTKRLFGLMPLTHCLMQTEVQNLSWTLRGMACNAVHSIV